MSLRLRKRVEEIFGWMKMVGSLRHTRYHGVARTGLAGYLVATTYIPLPRTIMVADVIQNHFFSSLLALCP